MSVAWVIKQLDPVDLPPHHFFPFWISPPKAIKIQFLGFKLSGVLVLSQDLLIND